MCGIQYFTMGITSISCVISTLMIRLPFSLFSSILCVMKSGFHLKYLATSEKSSSCQRFIKLTVYSLDHSKHISKEDVGFGTGIAKTLADAHEGGAKEAVTDALKRALRSLGSQFGNSLYDKSRNHQTQSQPQLQQNQQPSQPKNHQQSPQTQYEFTSLYNLGLQVLEQGNNYVVVGEDIFNKKDSIKACGFRWDASHKVWYLPKTQEAA